MTIGHILNQWFRSLAFIGRKWQLPHWIGDFQEADIFSATQGSGLFSWSGPLSSMYASRLIPFEKLLQHEDIRLRKVGQIGRPAFLRIEGQVIWLKKSAQRD